MGVVPVTRFKVAPAPLWKVTVEPVPMEKLFQSMMPFSEFWLMVRTFPDVVILPEPAVKVPPVGRLEAACRMGWRGIRVMSVVVRIFLNWGILRYRHRSVEMNRILSE